MNYNLLLSFINVEYLTILNLIEINFKVQIGIPIAIRTIKSWTAIGFLYFFLDFMCVSGCVNIISIRHEN